MSRRERRVDPDLSAKRAAAGRRGAAARWGHGDVANHGSDLAQRVYERLANHDNRRPRPQGRQDWVSIENRAGGGTAEVYIYDEVGYWGTTAQEFVDQLNELDVDTIDLHINSPGGDVFPALSIYNALVEHDAQVHTFVDGLAASAASFIAQAGDKVTMAANSQMMIHDAFGVCVGTSDDMEQMRALLDRISGNLASLYSARTGEGSTADWRDSMKAETWYSAQEAVAAGLADEVAAKTQQKRKGRMDDDEEASNRWDLSMFQHRGRAEAPAPTIRPANRHAPSSGDTIPVGGPGTDVGDASGSTARETGPAGNDPAPTEADADPFAELDDAVFATLGTTLDDSLADAFHFDPDVLRSSVADAYENADAPPTLPAPPPTPLTSIDIDEFVNSIQEAMQL